ncbi:hypothetical protein BDR03DRAFT_645248 [Suillus americanus]|nr:hypothetical protein BDR03DRAFT_645248 [Suillus americanus]
MILAKFILHRSQRTLNSKIDEVHLNLVRQCLSAETSRPPIKKVLYLVLVRSFGAIDLTNSVLRLNGDYHNSGGFAYVHKCKLYLRDINASVRQVDSHHQLSSTMTTYVDVAVKEILLKNDVNMSTIIRVSSHVFCLHSTDFWSFSDCPERLSYG